MYSTQTNTNTYTVTDIRKTFENTEADIRTIARRTDKWSIDYVDKIMHDIIKLAENKYLEKVSIALKRRSNNYILRAAAFKINEDGTKTDSDRAGRNNDWENIEDTYLTVYLSYSSKWRRLSNQQQKDFCTTNDFKIGWTSTSDDTTFSHLSTSNAQLYASKGYELQKTNYK
jgi:hypothetical protein